MRTVIPSTTVRSLYLTTLPLNTVYIDPRNAHSYSIQEKQVESKYFKVAVPYISGNASPIELSDVPPQFLKAENPVRANISHTLKQRITQLEVINKSLQSATFKQIQRIFGDKRNAQIADNIYSLQDGIVFHFQTNQFDSDNLKKSIHKEISNILVDATLLDNLEQDQPCNQSELLSLHTCTLGINANQIATLENLHRSG